MKEWILDTDDREDKEVMITFIPLRKKNSLHQLYLKESSILGIMNTT